MNSHAQGEKKDNGKLLVIMLVSVLGMGLVSESRDRQIDVLKVIELVKVTFR